jgi:6-methylsalicylate decarboxylase
MDPVDIEDNISRLYFDTAGGPIPHLLKFLLTITTPDKVMFGGDYPHTPSPIVINTISQLREFLVQVGIKVSLVV